MEGIFCVTSGTTEGLGRPAPRLAPHPGRPAPRMGSRRRHLPFSPFRGVLVVFNAFITFSVVVVIMAARLSIIGRRRHLRGLRARMTGIGRRGIDSRRRIAALADRTQLRRVTRGCNLASTGSDMEGIGGW